MFHHTYTIYWKEKENHFDVILIKIETYIKWRLFYTINLMEQFDTFISLLCPSQCKFIKNTEPLPPVPEKSKLVSLLTEPKDIYTSQWQKAYKLSGDDTSKLDTFETVKSYNLYASILCQLCPKYNMLFSFEQQYELIEEFIRFIISKLDTDMKIKHTIHNTKIHPTHLIEELKQVDTRSNLVIWYVSLVLDINIIVLTGDKVEVYFSELIYDNCKPHILLGRNEHDVYQPIIYDKMRLLTYFDHNIIKSLIDSTERDDINLGTFQK